MVLEKLQLLEDGSLVVTEAGEAIREDHGDDPELGDTVPGPGQGFRQMLEADEPPRGLLAD
ncbi:hypothetical protein ACFFIO_00215 [Citricoccus parietis]|uniref:Uncharacterized protein n=1 Tax=Citricoccus parietis TaxID=592307 RepID=A0ABV6F083_9MICC